MEQGQWAGADFQIPADRRPGEVILCGACRRLGACRLGLGSETLLSDGSVQTELACGPENEGGPGVAHGGWTASVFDEILGHVAVQHGRLAVTGQLSVTYLKPVPIGRPLRARAWIDKQEARRWHMAGELRLASTGALLGTGEAVMVLRDREHFARHARWLADQDASAAGGAGSSAGGPGPAPS